MFSLILAQARRKWGKKICGIFAVLNRIISDCVCSPATIAIFIELRAPLFKLTTNLCFTLKDTYSKLIANNNRRNVSKPIKFSSKDMLREEDVIRISATTCKSAIEGKPALVFVTSQQTVVGNVKSIKSRVIFVSI